MQTNIDATKLYPREPLTRIINQIRPESFVYEVVTDRMNNNTVNAILKGDLITVSKSSLSEVAPGKQYVVTDSNGNIILGSIENDTPNQAIHVVALNSSYHKITLKYGEIAGIEVIYLLDRVLKTPAKIGDELIFEPKQNEITQNEYDSLKGLALFVKSNNPYSPGYDSPVWNGHPCTFIFRMQDLLTDLDNFVNGRFKEDGGIENLQWIYKNTLATHPHVAEKIFYGYSELMKLLVGIYKQAELISHFSGVFENLIEKQEYFSLVRN